MSALDLARLVEALPPEIELTRRGRLLEVSGLAARAALEGACVGDVLSITRPGGAEPLLAEIVGVRDATAVVLPIGELRGVAAGAAVERHGGPLAIDVGEALRGRVLDGLGRPMDGGPPPRGLQPWPVDRPCPPPLARGRIRRPLSTGVRAIDALLTIGEGQRVGLFAGSGVGKSTLLGQIARGCSADLAVVGLVGERGREVREFVEEALGPEGLARSVVVAATSDAPPLVRLRAAHVATAIAEWFAEVAGQRVLFLLDSVTRFARAQREVGLAAGEPPARQGYPPSVFAALPQLLERTGVRTRGSITAFYTVLVAGGDLDEPIADEVRGILDGHVVLDRAIAARGRWPAVDVLASLSRLMPALASPAHLAAAARVRSWLAAYERQRELIAAGAYAPGSDPATDEAIARMPRIEELLAQGAWEPVNAVEALSALAEVAA